MAIGRQMKRRLAWLLLLAGVIGIGAGLLGWHALLSLQGEAEQAYLPRTLFPLMGGLWLAIAGLCGLAL